MILVDYGCLDLDFRLTFFKVPDRNRIVSVICAGKPELITLPCLN